MDWSYGRIIAVHLKKKGTSYTGEQETFVSGRPLNVTDGCIGPDRAMWFITGGRGTQSGLYRITFSGGSASPAQVNAKAIQGPDRFALHAARLQAESTASERSMDQVTSFKEGPEALSRWLVAVRSGNPALISAGIRMALALPWEKASIDEKLGALRVLAIGLSRGGTLTAEQQSAAIVHFESQFPAADPRLNRELCRTLVYFKSSKVIEKILPLLKAATNSEDLLFYPFMLRYLKEGWTLEARRVCFTALNRAEKLNGASTYFKAISDTRSELAAALSPTDAKTLASVIFPPKPTPLLPTAMPGHSFKNWKLTDLAPKLDQVSRGRSFEKAKAALISTQCVFCHKVSNDPALPAGVFGPDLTQVSARFNRQDLLMHILEPSKFIDEKFKLVTLTKKDGSTMTGSLDSEDDERITLRINPLAADTTEIGKSMIRSRQISDISPMPPGLLNTLKAEQILDLLAWFEAGGDPKHRAFQP